MDVVVVGGGVGGLTVAKELSRARGQVDVTLIDRSLRHDFAPSFLWLLTGYRKPKDVSRSLNSLEGESVKVVEAEVTGVDTTGQTVSTSAGEIAYAELVLAPGARLAPEAVPGLESNAHIFYTREGAERLHQALTQFEGGKVLVTVTSMPYKCPAAPYEAAFLIDDFLKRRQVEAEVRVVTVEPQPMPVAGPAIGAQVVQTLEAHGIGFAAGRQLESVDGQAGLANFQQGPAEPYNLLVAIPPHRPPDFIAGSGLAGESGWVPVDPGTLEAAPNVHAIGDVTAIPLANGMVLPKAGVFAHGQGKVVARNLLAKDSAGKSRFKGNGSCFLEIGAGRAGFASGNFYASPAPQVKMRRPGRIWHWGKVLFERSWLRKL